MKIYSKSHIFKIHAWMVPLGRIAIILAGLSLFSLCLMHNGFDRYPHIIYTALFFAVLWIIFICSGVFLATCLKCDFCGKRLTITWCISSGSNKKPNNELNAIINDFYPLEIREGKFTCIHCGTEYSLNKE